MSSSWFKLTNAHTFRGRPTLKIDLPQGVSISGAEINLTFRAVSTGVLCCKLAESKSVLKIFFVDWNILYKLCASAKKENKGLLYLVGYVV